MLYPLRTDDSAIARPAQRLCAFLHDDLDGCWRRPRLARRRNTVSTAILVPGRLGALHVFTRRAPGPLAGAGAVSTLDGLFDHLVVLPRPRVVVLCGARHFEDVAPTARALGELYVVPAHWLAEIPPGDLLGRATCAARLVAAWRRRPIEHITRFPTPLNPF